MNVTPIYGEFDANSIPEAYSLMLKMEVFMVDPLLR
jgi:hypothetical protein